MGETGALIIGLALGWHCAGASGFSVANREPAVAPAALRPARRSQRAADVVSAAE